jgi:demethylmenaquinone methyltransferase/2-methoxy-6-polyprenyl-1,4-benzoquinol methylase
MNNNILSEQIDYYRARAPEYDASLRSILSFDEIDRVLFSLGQFDQVPELACGTGIWSEKLVKLSRQDDYFFHLTGLSRQP